MLIYIYSKKTISEYTNINVVSAKGNLGSQSSRHWEERMRIELEPPVTLQQTTKVHGGGGGDVTSGDLSGNKGEKNVSAEEEFDSEDEI